jgi:hypothetical protein
MTDSQPKGHGKTLIIAVALVAVAAIAAGTYIYQKNQQDQKVFTLQIGNQTISATVTTQIFSPGCTLTALAMNWWARLFRSFWSMTNPFLIMANLMFCADLA